MPPDQMLSDPSFEPYQPPTGPGQAEPAQVEAFACPNCGSTQFNPGFIDDTANGMLILGPVELGLRSASILRATSAVSACPDPHYGLSLHSR